LLDLSGHTADNRLPVFAWKPAPVQATWLGYFSSTGLGTIDYILADPVSIPESLHAHFRERVWYLPDTRLCFSPPGPESQFPVATPPALERGYVTFGSFQGMYKLQPAVLALWAQILRAIPGARLRLQNEAFDRDEGRRRILDQLKVVGIDPQRVSFAGLQPRDKYLLAHADVDILLDTFPYPGGTTTCEALWMGVPTITLTGESMLSRQGHSLLHCAGLDDWVATDPADYVQRATRHANGLPALAMLRKGLRQQVLASPLFDGSRFARQLAEAFRGMWAAHAGKPH
jgi:protein O-GlcNAc transferase